MVDKINLEILADGTISVTTDGISSQNHQSADDFLETLEDLMGGKLEIKKKKRHHSHLVGKRKVTHSH